MTSLALFNLDPRIGLGNNVFGKDVANFRLFQALVRHGGLDEAVFLMTEPAPPERVRAALAGGDTGAARVRTTHLLDQRAPAEAGAMLRGSGKLEELAWLRRQFAGETAYSLIGLIHTLGPPAIRADLFASSVAPLHRWDALICTSPSVRAVMVRMFDEWEAFLSERFGGTRAPPRVALPVIPLGVDGVVLAAQADRPDARKARREALGVGEDDVLLVWVGRLSFFEKAFPQPMMRAAEEAARLSGKRIHFAMVGWFPSPDADGPKYRAAAAAYAPSVQFHVVSGNDPAVVADMWAAADIFVSLVDNIQETFGLTPIEAMAAGVPVVVSDWDGYRFTVRDGEEGFLIPTMVGPPGVAPQGMVAGHAVGTKSYQQYVGVIGQHTAVHVGRAAEAIARLAGDVELRRRLGAAGRARVAEMFDWRVVAPQYVALAGELTEVRAAAPPTRRAPHPFKGDPFADFAGFATEVLRGDTRLTLHPGAGLDDLARSRGLQLDMFGGNWRGSIEEAEALVRALATGPATAAALVTRYPAERHAALTLTLLWLIKLGIVDWQVGGAAA